MKRREYPTYDKYLEHQKEKTTNPALRKKLLARWEADCRKFREQFELLTEDRGKAICLGARMGAEVAVLQEMGFDAIGIDLVPCPPLVIPGDFHQIPFPENNFDLAYSNSIDHVYDLDKFSAEIRRILRPGGYLLVWLGPENYGKYEAIEIGSVANFTAYFPDFEVLEQKDNGRPGVSRRITVLMKSTAR